MTTGNSAWNGLGMGLNGESELTQIVAGTDFLTMTAASSISGDFLVLRQSDATELFYVDYKGTIYIRNSVAVTAYLAIDARSIISDGATGTWYAGAGFRLTNNARVAGQVYPLNLHYIGSATANNIGGRAAALNLTMACATGYGGIGSTQLSFINFNDGGTQNIPALFTMPATTTADDMFAASACTASTHTLKVNIGGTDYYILLSTCTP